MTTVTFYSYKGGTGRTLLVANTAVFLASAGKRVVLLDFDLEAPGLPYKFGLMSPGLPWSAGRGIVGELAEYLRGDSKELNVARIMKELPVRGDGWGQVTLVPAGSAPSSKYVKDLSQIDWFSLYWGADEGTDGNRQSAAVSWQEVFADIKTQVEAIGADYLLVDSRTGLADISGVSLNFLPDIIVCLLLHNNENQEGARQALRGAKNVARMDNRPLRILPVVTRIPPSQFAEHRTKTTSAILSYLTQRDDETGSALSDADLEQVLCLHSEPALELVEKLLLQSDDITLRESSLLNDYLSFFKALDPAAFERSPLAAPLRLLSNADLDRWLVTGVHSKEGVEAGASSTTENSPIEAKVKDRKTLRIVNAYFLQDAKEYQGFCGRIGNELCRQFGVAPEPVDENTIVYDLLGFQMRQGRFDFCAEAYFLTQLRGELSDLLQFGELRTFVMVFVDPAEGHPTLKRKNTRILESWRRCLGSEDAVVRHNRSNSPGLDLSQTIDTWKDLIGPTLRVGMLGDTAATSAATPVIAERLTALQIKSYARHKRLAQFLVDQSYQFRIAFLDHGVFSRVLRLPESKDITFCYQVLKLPAALSVGFLLPRGDDLWRRKIASATAVALRAAGKRKWNSIREELKTNADIEVFTFADFCRYLSLDMTLPHARDWLNSVKDDLADAPLTSEGQWT